MSNMMLSGDNSDRYNNLKDDLANDFTKGVDNYPKSTEEVVNLLNK